MPSSRCWNGWKPPSVPEIASGLWAACRRGRTDDAAPVNPPPAPNGPRGWSDQPYSEAWGIEFRYLLAQHVTNALMVVDPATNSIPVNPMERMTLIVTRGWKVSTATNAP